MINILITHTTRVVYNPYHLNGVFVVLGVGLMGVGLSLFLIYTYILCKKLYT